MVRRMVLIATVSLSAAAHACSEASDGAPIVSTSGSMDGGALASGANAAAVPGSSAPVQDASTVNRMLLNEISPREEWVELVNTGNQAVDISGWYVSDREKDGGGPKLDEASKVPPGTILSPNSYLLVRGGGRDGGTSCPDGGQSYCVHAEFQISNKNGETIFLLGPDGNEVAHVDYPAQAAPKGASWGRIPSGDPSGVFQATVMTPGAPNRTK